ncbi:PAS domain-containing sensor histidine kinase [Hymenobacter sp. ASUV-10]|uniref:histidine kinase n=1 Tax=Hymenobacter aranciens TaxID=3063996 RepID=A0ABT9B728_9BACT|nr:PAS domain-containing sensor histidine kinase [Hymenobacter sp. ASUV-10]MDO7874086.1 PAS domain-containing sensor histidine kinase [Hymenobacter sp. ASUV-10]
MNAEPEDGAPAGHDLRLTQQNAEELYEQAPCGYCSCLPDGTLVKLNQTLLDWLGYTREELVARQGLQQLLTMGGALHFELHGMPLLLLQGYVRELSYELRRKNGTTQAVLLNATLLRDTDGSPLVARLTMFDITARRQYELELLQAKQLADSQREQLAQANAALLENNKLLTRTNADLDTFIYTASHDLRAPITNIDGLLTLLHRQLPPEVRQATAIAHILGLMKTSVDRFMGTIHQLTDIIRLQKSQAPHAETIDLAALLDDICLDLTPQLRAAAVQLTVEVSQCPEVAFAPKHLRSILYNLVSNSIKYRHPDRPPAVVVRCRRHGTTTILEVEDNGLGMSAAQQGKLFGLFQRLHYHVQGSGVGLYMVKRIVENAGGTITVQSQPNVGATFTVALPAQAVSSEEPALQPLE